MAKLWQKDYQMDSLLEDFTVGIDYILDKQLLRSDCLASIAHLLMLKKIGILKNNEAEALEKALREIIREDIDKGFPIKKEDEDCHTAIENSLIQRCGESGKKIHTGRSRNDQVLTASRVYTRSFLLKIQEQVLILVQSLRVLAADNIDTPMPGRTHMQIAMPSSVGLWATSFAEDLLDCASLVENAYQLNNRCPLGSAASYGVPLPLDREYTAQLLAFDGPHHNVLSANNSRGRIESIILSALDQISLVLSKLAQDLIIFSMPEFAYFSLPPELCSGSSIMPQKKNPDGLELVRAKAAVLNSCESRVKNIIRSLPSGYNRDFQETKAPFIEGLQLSLAMLRIMDLSINKLQINKEKLSAGFIPEIYATDLALELVEKGQSFRDAYKKVGLNLEKLKQRDPLESIQSRKSTGCSGNLDLDYIDNQLKPYQEFLIEQRSRVEKMMIKIYGKVFRLLP